MPPQLRSRRASNAAAALLSTRIRCCRSSVLGARSSLLTEQRARGVFESPRGARAEGDCGMGRGPLGARLAFERSAPGSLERGTGVKAARGGRASRQTESVGLEATQEGAAAHADAKVPRFKREEIGAPLPGKGEGGNRGPAAGKGEGRVEKTRYRRRVKKSREDHKAHDGTARHVGRFRRGPCFSPPSVGESRLARGDAAEAGSSFSLRRERAKHRRWLQCGQIGRGATGRRERTPQGWGPRARGRQRKGRDGEGGGGLQRSYCGKRIRCKVQNARGVGGGGSWVRAGASSSGSAGGRAAR